MTTLLKDTRKIMVERLVGNLTLKEKQFHSIISSLPEQINKLGYSFYRPIPPYQSSFIDLQRLRKFTNEWAGPCTKGSETISSEKWKERGENWIDSQSYKITGSSFFALHIRQSRTYLIRQCCRVIMSISRDEKEFVFRYCATELVVELLTAMVRHHVGIRPTSKALIPYKTLRNSDDILQSLGQFHSSLDLSATRLSKRKKIDSTEFYTEILEIARGLKDKYANEWNAMKQSIAFVNYNGYHMPPSQGMHANVLHPITTDDYLATLVRETESHTMIADMQNREDNVAAVNRLQARNGRTLEPMRHHYRNVDPMNNVYYGINGNKHVIQWANHSVQFINTLSKVGTLSHHEWRMLQTVKRVLSSFNYNTSHNQLHVQSNYQYNATRRVPRATPSTFVPLSTVNAHAATIPLAYGRRSSSTTTMSTAMCDDSPRNAPIAHHPLPQNTNSNQVRHLQRPNKRKRSNDYEEKCDLQSHGMNTNSMELNTNKKRKLNDLTGPFPLFDHNANSNNRVNKESSNYRRPIGDYFSDL
eukprot:639991_1